MDKLLKPQQLSVDPNSSEATKQWKHRLRSFENYLESIEQARQEDKSLANKLRILTNSVDFKIFNLIESGETYEAAIRVLHNLFVKTPNAIFARDLLATAKQQPEQTLNEFIQFPHSSRKNCGFRTVSV